ncbi:MAG: hypothetical protein Q9M30_05190 [Mariprofundaceae bacterium]|nr:hypothetical protein [Mariprofundaceae bacterium]
MPMRQSFHHILSDFIDNQLLPADLLPMMQRFHLPLAEHLKGLREGRVEAVLLGINGAQGSGKSTLAAALAAICKQAYGWRVAILSMDDLYLSRVRRQALARDVHPLLATRGVPGTHDVPLGLRTLASLRLAAAGNQVLLPRFDKVQDEPVPQEGWESASGPFDLIIFEGWCLGAMPQQDSELIEPCNDLERIEDAEGVWRRFVNRQLAEVYAPLFSSLDYRVFLQVPGFESVLRWRREQEDKLRSSSGALCMGQEELTRFICYFERLTRHQLACMPALSDAVFVLNPAHGIDVAVYRDAG